MRELLRQWFCGLRGHVINMIEEPTRLFLKCERCGMESAGWDVPKLIAPPRWRRFLRYRRRMEAA